MKQSKRELIDELFKEAAEKSLSDIIKKYPTLEELEGKYEFSNKHNKKMKRFFKKAEKVESRGNIDAWHTFRRMSFNAAAVLCMLFTILTLVAFTVPEIRVEITNYIVEKNEEHIVISTESNMYKGEIIKGAPKYIPEGFEVNSYTETEIILDIMYSSGDNRFIYYTRSAGETMLTLDNENSNFTNINIAEHLGYISQKNDEVTIIFHDGEYTYYIVSDIDRDEMIKIAVSIIE